MAFTVTVASADDTAAGKKNHSHRGFERFDTNKDGKITREESRKAAQERFNRADANRDGSLTKEELKASFEKKRAERKGGSGDAKHEKAKKHHQLGGFFAKFNANKDAKISRTEATKLADQRFARFDKNNDGAVTRKEMRAAHREMKKNRHHKKDGSKRGEWRRTEGQQSAQRAPGAHKNWQKCPSSNQGTRPEIAHEGRGDRLSVRM